MRSRVDGKCLLVIKVKDETVQQRCKVWEMEKVNKLAFLLGTTGPAGCCRQAVWLARWRGINKER